LGIGNDVEGSVQPEMVEIWNKIDLLDEDKLSEMRGIAQRNSDILLLSAVTGEGIEDFKNLLSDLIAKKNVTRAITLPSSDGAAFAWLHARGKVDVKRETKELLHLDVSLSRQFWGQFEKKFKFVARDELDA
jgi:GTPase